MDTRHTSAPHTVLLLIILIALAAAMLVAACGDTGTPSPGSPKPTPTVTIHEGMGAIAFIKDQHLYTIWSYGGTGRKLIAENAHCAAWSPDGDQIAYGNPDGLFVAKADGSEQRRVVAMEMGHGGSGIAWSPDGKRIAFSAPGGYVCQLWIVNADGSDLTNLSEVMDRGGSGPFAFTPAWSPQGRIYIGTVGEIAAVDPDGSDLETVTAADDTIPGFSLSHDGKWLLLWDSRSGGCVRMAANGRGVASTILDESPCRDQGEASSWSPDGERIVFAGPSCLYVVGVDGSHLRVVPNTGGGSNPVWQALPLED